MFSEKEFLIEFPADRDYIPFIQSFLKDFLNNFDFSAEFSERASIESLRWFYSIIPKEKHLHALPTISFRGKTSEKGLQVQIQTTEEKVFKASLSLQHSGDAQ
ncbi:MAG: hypothetical protein FWB90_01745 [Fibromonadales bacterium]|nr:hypothetical protein [Fibromonadales bacterium]